MENQLLTAEQMYWARLEKSDGYCDVPTLMKEFSAQSMAHNAMLREALKPFLTCGLQSHHNIDCNTNIVWEASPLELENVRKALNATEPSVKAWRAKENDAAYQRGYAEAERLAKIDLTTITEERNALLRDLASVIETDKTYYTHHEPRPDGKLPKELGGTIWLTPKEIASRRIKALAQKGGA